MPCDLNDEIQSISDHCAESVASMPSNKGAERAFIAGAVSGMIEAAAVHPLDMVKTRHQLNQGVNDSIRASLSSLLKEGGVLRLYRGLVPELVGMMPTRSAMWGGYSNAHAFILALGYEDSRFAACAAGLFSGVPEAVVTTPFQSVKVSVWNGVYFFVIHDIKTYLGRQEESTLRQLWKDVTAGFIAGWIATCFNAPFDMAKSRAQSGSDGLSSMGTWKILFHVAKEEGLLACYKGFWPKSVRMAFGGGIGAAAFSMCMKIIE